MDDHPLLDMTNRLVHRLRETRDPVFGLFLLSGSPLVAELSGVVGADFVVFDMEASPMNRSDALTMTQALTGSRTAPLVRVAWSQQHLIEHAMDLGVRGVLVPKIDTPAQAKQAALATRYPPAGTRGVNPVRASAYFANIGDYLARANDSAFCAVQIESPEAVAAADGIAAVPGVDCLFIGMGDLASTLGQPGQMTGPRMDEARRRVLDACERNDKYPGIFAYDLDLAVRYAEEGFRVIAIGNDLKLLKDAAERSLRTVRSGRDTEVGG